MEYNSQHNFSVSDLLKKDLKLASPPNLYFELQRVIENPNKTIVDVAFVIEKDAALAIRLLKIVNSAFYGFPSKITSINHAINIIGSRELQTLVLATIVIDRFSGIPKDLISMHDFWAGNLRCALIAQEIDRYLDKSFVDSIFICGILHNIGQLVFFQCIPELAKKVCLSLQTDDVVKGRDEVKFEREIIGFDHFEVGSALTKLWKLPDVITESIRLHSYPDNAEEYTQVASILRVADTYSKLDDLDEEVKSNLDIPISDMSEIIDKAYDQFDDIFKVFYPE